MTPTLEIDTTALNAAMAEMVRATGISRAKWVKVEGAAILDKCIGRTKMATIGKMNEQAAKRARQSVNKSGDRTAYLTHKGVIFVYSNKSQHHIRAGTFNPATNAGGLDPIKPTLGRSLQSAARSALSSARSMTKENAELAKRARGLAVQSWVQIADAAELPIKQTPKVATARKAVASTGIFYNNGSAITTIKQDLFTIRMANTLPYNTKIGMGGMFSSAMAGRVKYFEQNLRRGVFEDMAAVAKRYPGMRALP